ncbi:MAG: 16S rRNA (uracil(1498)-N(3))-methyltransferase [Alphaproteobacteria bacterium]|nr:16S rRNA (uracil(1498)-N(3))-methyltransferase [Alphaproteobacteria bacterium]
MKIKNKIRLFVDTNLQEDTKIELTTEQSHYLCNVMRLKDGDSISCFNGKNGEFLSQIIKIHKKQTQVNINKRIKAQKSSPDIWLLFAPLKKDCTDFLIQKSVELGVKGLLPIITENSITDKVRVDRLQAQIIEASEQCERLDIPQLFEPQNLNYVLKNWDNSRVLYLMDERRQGVCAAKAFGDHAKNPSAILIGPEGGFSDSEFKSLYKLPFVCGVSMGPRILRAETAAVAALSVWQAVAGDWKGENK